MRAWREILTLASAIVPAWFVWNPGGSGGSGTVHTDGVTIQGDGSIATPIALLDAITDGTTLTGAGISANKLRVKPVDYFTFGQPDNFVGLDTNFLSGFGFVAPCPITFSNLLVTVAGNDPAETVDMGFYDATGNLVANIGGTSVTAGGIQTFPFLQGAQTIPQGRYLFCVNSTGGAFALYGDVFAGNIYWYFSPFFQPIVTPGSLPATVAFPAITPTQGSFGVGLF